MTGVQTCALPISHIKPKMKICDIGCGANPVLLNYISDIIFNKPVGLDFCVENYEDKNIELRKTDLDKLPLPVKEGEFDLITMLAVLEHLNNYDEVIGECKRGLKDGGKLLMTTPSPLSKPILELLANLRIISKAAIDDHKQYFKKSEISDLLRKHGFTDIKVWSVACGLNTVALARV